MSAPRNHGDELIENRAEDQRARDQPHRPVPTPTLPFLTSRPVQPATNNDGVSRAIDRLIDTQEQLTTAIERQVADTAGLISAFRDMMTIASQNAVINNHIHHRNSQLIETSRRETFVQ